MSQREKELPGPAGSLPYASPSFGQAIKYSLEELRDGYSCPEGKVPGLGGKGVAALFDGREGQEVAESTVSRWISEPERFRAVLLPVLVEASPSFRSFVFQHIAARMTVPAVIARRMKPAAADEMARAVQSVIVEEAGPGRWVRR